MPRLKSRKSEYETNGWAPLFNVQTRSDLIETIVTALSLIGPELLRFSAPLDLDIDTEAPAYFRFDPDNSGTAEIDYFDSSSSESRAVFVKCL